MKADEVRSLPDRYLRLIVLIEARAAPPLRTVNGLWRKEVLGRGSAQPRPGSMTTLIRAEGLLPRAEVDRIIRTAPAELLDFQAAAARGALGDRAPMSEWIERFNAGSQRIAM